MDLILVGALSTMTAGAVGGVSLWVAVFPADVIKSRAQVLTAGSQEPGFMKMMVQIARTEGIYLCYLMCIQFTDVEVVLKACVLIDSIIITLSLK